MTPRSRTKINLILLFALISLLTVGAFSVLEYVHLAGQPGDAGTNVLWIAKLQILGVIVGVGTLVYATQLLNTAFKREMRSAAETKRFSSLVQNSGDIIAIGSADRMLQYINPSGKLLLGISDEMLAQGFRTADLYGGDDGTVVKEQVLPALRSSGSWKGSIRFKNQQNGELIQVQMNAFSLYDISTNELIGFATVAKDMREELKLKKELDRFFEVSLDMMAIANVHGYFLRLNPAFTEILGYTQEELLSRPASDFIHPDDIAATIRQLEKQAKGESILSFENRYRTKSGDYRWFSWKSFPDGELTYGAARDVTEEKEQAALMEQLSQSAVAASKAKSEFLANMSHEIRTPINGVIGTTTLLLDTPLSEEQREYAENVHTSAQSLLTVINDVLDFSKIEAGKLDIETVDFDLENVIDDTVKNVAWAFRNKSIPFTLDYDKSQKYQYRGDPGRIRQILMNLLSNAVKFTKEGSVKLEVKALSTTESSTQFRFAVQDTGIGISSEAKARLFQAFSQADASTTRRFGGTGLGLSISHRLVQLMGGDIGVDSEEGQGSTFWFTLNLQNSNVAPSVKKPLQQIPRTKFEGASILVAEDNTINQKIVLAMLKKMGFKAQAVANGSEVLSILHERTFDLILMDCQMPEMDGYEATRKIRESKSLLNMKIPIIAMTANALKGDREKCLEAGMDDYATKPVIIDTLAGIIERWLEKSGVSEKTPNP